MENIRNFSIIAHIDHGKSTLADRFLELTNTVPQDKMKPCYLEMMDLEREKGITIKMRPVRMNYKGFILNLIDTPGHVDFSYEVSRSLAAVEGAILLVDATKGIQAQTISNLELATKQNLVIIPAINKIDSPQARTEEIKNDLATLLGINPEEILSISGKDGTNTESLLQKTIEKIPAPTGNIQKPFRALIFDSKFDIHKGVIAFVRVFDGEIKNQDKIYLLATKAMGDIKEIGYFKPELYPCQTLKAGEIGYIATGIKEPGQVRVGDTITQIPNFKIQSSEINVQPLPGYKEAKSMVFASLYPQLSEEYEKLREGLIELKLNDASLIFEPESQDVLGRGFRCGFLGMLHAEIVIERLKREYDLDLIISSPSVLYKIKTKNGKEYFLRSVNEFPDQSFIEESEEPWVKIEIMAPSSYIGKILELMELIEGKYNQTKYFGQTTVLVEYEVPLRNIISNFYDQLKNITQGYGSMNYEVLNYRKAKLVKIDILISGNKEGAFSRIVPEENAQEEGKRMVERLKNALPPQMFAVALQAAVSGKIIARETMSAMRRDVIAPLYGGDYTRKRKLLEQQKKGKKELKEKGQVRVPASVFLEMMKR